MMVGGKYIEEVALAKIVPIKPGVFDDRRRTNLLRKPEQQLIMFFLKLMPPFVTPNILTLIGIFGSVIVFAAFLSAAYWSNAFLLAGIAGLFINWFGDSLDGRLAYYRQTPRKWFGFALDIMMDWASTVLIGMGYFFYAHSDFKIFAFLFVVLYGWSIVLALLKYKTTDNYSIDSGLLGPTELRIVIALVLTAEVLSPGIIHYCSVALTVVLVIINTIESKRLLELATIRDTLETEKNKKTFH